MEMVLLLFFCSMLASVALSQQVPAMFIFGDSLVDVGNNDVLPTTAKANHLPYGIDFDGRGPTGRFCNGRVVVDFIASFMGLPFPPPYHLAGNNIIRGANFASASSGILPYTHQEGAEPLFIQVNNFENVQRALIQRLGAREGQTHIARSIFYICIGNNDMNNHFQQSRSMSPDFIQTVINTLIGQIERLHGLGARKFVIQGLSAVGCIPLNQFRGQCNPGAQAGSIEYNTRLTGAIGSLQGRLRDSHFTIPNFFDLMVATHNNPRAFGFDNAVTACCAVGSSVLDCNPGARICPNRRVYNFWDAIHQTEAFNSIAAARWWAGPPADVFPISIRELVAL